MSIQFNHRLVHARDKKLSAAFLAELLGLPEPATFGRFHCGGAAEWRLARL